MRWRCQFLSFLLSLVERTPKSVWNSGSSSINPLLNFYPCVYVCVCVCFSQSVSHSRTPLHRHSTVSCNTMLIVVALHVWTVRYCTALCGTVPVPVSELRPVEQNSLEAGKETPHILCNQEAHYLAHRSRPFHPVVSQFNTVHTLLHCFINLTIIIIVPSMLMVHYLQNLQWQNFV
jgi:hypothetical protein